MIEERFGESVPFSLGVEEELMILDASTFGQVPAVDRILRGVEGLELPGSLKTELFASVFETNTNVCATAADPIIVRPKTRIPPSSFLKVMCVLPNIARLRAFFIGC